MTRQELINTLRQGSPISSKLVQTIIIHLEMAGHMEQNLKYYQAEVQHLEDVLTAKEG